MSTNNRNKVYCGGYAEYKMIEDVKDYEWDVHVDAAIYVATESFRLNKDAIKKDDQVHVLGDLMGDKSVAVFWKKRGGSWVVKVRKAASIRDKLVYKDTKDITKHITKRGAMYNNKKVYGWHYRQAENSFAYVFWFVEDVIKKVPQAPQDSQTSCILQSNCGWACNSFQSHQSLSASVPPTPSNMGMINNSNGQLELSQTSPQCFMTPILSPCSERAFQPLPPHNPMMPFNLPFYYLLEEMPECLK